MVEFETINAKEVQFGNNKFLEIARKRAKTEQGENEIITISKGFTSPDGSKRFKNALGFEASEETKQAIIEALQEI